MNFSFLSTQELVRFNENISKFSQKNQLNHAYIGFNYNDTNISSVKFYYSFKSIESQFNAFPIPILKDYFIEYWNLRSDFHINNPLIQGGGVTFAIKFYPNFDQSFSFYFRVSNQNNTLVDNIIHQYKKLSLIPIDFEDGFGIYVTVLKNKIKLSKYLYLKNVRKINLPNTDIDFKSSICVEITNTELNTLDRKFIAIGDSNNISHEFVKKIPSSIMEIYKGLSLKMYCPAFNPYNDSNSIYLFNDFNSSEIENNPIQKFLKKSEI